MTGETSSVFDALGLDPETIEWQDLGLCQGTPTNNFYDEYEANPRLAATIDQMCLSCPVMKQCLVAGMENKEYGVWGGVFLTNGEQDANKNSHKTEEVWNAIRDRISG